MSLADLRELDEIKGLVDRGRQLGVLTFAEVAGAVSELDLDEADVEELHGFLERAAIELVEELDPALAGGGARARAGEAWAPQAEDGAGSEAGDDDRFASAVFEGDRQGASADGAGGGRSGEADRAR